MRFFFLFFLLVFPFFFLKKNVGILLRDIAEVRAGTSGFIRPLDENPDNRPTPRFAQTTRFSLS